jgi:transcription termination factor Rho
MDQVIFEEFKGTGNMEVFLSREIANHRLFPSIDIARSNTRKKELLMDPVELEQTDNLRRKLLSLSPVEAAKTLIELLQKYPTNKELLSQEKFPF